MTVSSNMSVSSGLTSSLERTRWQGIWPEDMGAESLTRDGRRNGDCGDDAMCWVTFLADCDARCDDLSVRCHVCQRAVIHRLGYRLSEDRRAEQSAGKQAGFRRREAHVDGEFFAMLLTVSRQFLTFSYKFKDAQQGEYTEATEEEDIYMIRNGSITRARRASRHGRRYLHRAKFRGGKLLGRGRSFDFEA